MTNTPIQDINGNEIDTRWLHEFCGFFAGEGCLMAYYRKNPQWGHTFSVRAQIGLRYDDVEILREIQRKLGGQIRIDKHGVARWRVSQMQDCERLVAILEQSVLPAVKLRQLPYWKDCWKVKRGRPPNGYGYSDEQIEQIKFLVEKLRELKRVKK